VGQTSAFQRVLESLGDESFSKGTRFERVLKWWLQNDDIWSKELLPDSVKLWEESNYRTGPDIGIDLTAKDIHGNVWAIQAKNWNPDVVLPKSEIDKFLTASNTKNFQKRLLVTTTNVISTNALRAIQEQEKPVVVVSKANLEVSEIWEFFNDSFRPAKVTPKKKLFPHQSEAIKAVTSSFKLNTRGQLLMACGSGKTITAQRIQEKLDSETTLILLPSLLLVEQTLKSWRAEASKPFLALSVCSDSSVNGDEPLSKTSDLPFPVTTDPNEIRKFLQLSGKKVIFSTYQSSQKIEEAVKGKRFQFDLVICDEAHRLAGKVDKAYGTVFREGAIPSRRYLFMTATPKIFSSRLKVQAGENDIEIHSMDDEEKFGPVFYNFSFAKAIDAEVLTDYKVVVMGVDDSSIRDLVENRQFIDFQDTTLDASTLAAHFGIAKAMKTHSIKRVISFHSRVERAREFATTHKNVVAHLSGNFSSQILSEAISGKDSVFRRKQLLDKLRDLDGVESGIVTNAKCLTEGVDVPSLDGVAFVDPRSSQVDIVQAVGRAIRKGGREKSVGYIILPVFFSSKNLDEQTIDESQFAPVWQVLNALKSHDTKLEEEINTLRRGLGQKKPSAELPSKIIFDLPVGLPVEFSDKIKTYLLEKTSSIWEEWFARLETFAQTNGHCRPKRESQNLEERALSSWAMQQRHSFNKGKLLHDRVRKLETIPLWTWDPMDSQWMEYFERLSNYASVHNSSRVPSTVRDQEGRPLGKWVAKLRAKRESLSTEQKNLIEALPDWTWDPFLEAWEVAFEEIQELAIKKSDSVFSRNEKFKDGRSIGGWVIKQRQDRNRLSDRQASMLESLPKWSWDPFDDLKEVTKVELLEYVSKYGNSLVPLKFESDSGFSLGNVVSRIRQDARKGKLDPDLRHFVELLPGWVWHTKNDKWDSQFELLQVFLKEYSRYPRKGEKYKDIAIGKWVTVQRRMLTDGSLSEDRKARLDALVDWTWNTRDQQWESAFIEVENFVKNNGGEKPKDKDKSPSGFGVGAWVYQQRKNWEKLSPQQQSQLSKLTWFSSFTISSPEEKWVQNFSEVKTFIRENERTPKYKGQQVKSPREKQLGLWLIRQATTFESLDPQKQKQLSELPGFSVPQSPSEVWSKKFDSVSSEVAKTHQVPPFRISGKENPNGKWIRRQKKQFELLTKEQRALLLSVPEIRKFIQGK
jgi:superfamily II DNA or RNA helicase